MDFEFYFHNANTTDLTEVEENIIAKEEIRKYDSKRGNINRC